MPTYFLWNMLYVFIIILVYKYNNYKFYITIRSVYSNFIVYLFIIYLTY